MFTQNLRSKKSELQLSQFQILTSQKDQIDLNGTVGLDKKADLSGTIALANPPVQGSFMEANADKQGRLLIPFHVAGDLLDPKMSFAEQTFQSMTQKTLDLEKKRLTSKATDATKQELEKQKNDLKEKAKDQLKKAVPTLTPKELVCVREDCC